MYCCKQKECSLWTSQGAHMLVGMYNEDLYFKSVEKGKNVQKTDPNLGIGWRDGQDRHGVAHR